MEIVFDFLIYFYLGAIGVYLIHTCPHGKRLPRRCFSVLLFFALALSWAVIFYGSFIEPRMLIVNHQEKSLTTQPTETLRAVFFSDLHVGPFKKQDWTRRVVKRVMELQPDVIFISGDFVVTSAQDAKDLAALKGLSAQYGVYAVTGNHDYDANAIEEVIQTLETAGIRVLENEGIDLDVGGKALRIAGVSDIWFEGDLEKTMKNVEDEQRVILLSHNPDIMLKKESRKADLVLSGHTHGGQIRLPWIGPVPALPTRLGRFYDEGWFDFEGAQLFITSGVGESGTRARLFNPPEIVQMNIKL